MVYKNGHFENRCQYLVVRFKEQVIHYFEVYLTMFIVSMIYLSQLSVTIDSH